MIIYRMRSRKKVNRSISIFSWRIMQKFTILFTFSVIIFLASLCVAQEKDVEEIPPGMEIIKVGTTRLLVPQGITVQKKGGLIILENINEYVARQLFVFDTRIRTIEEREEKLQEQLRALREQLKNIEEDMIPKKSDTGL